MTDPKLHRHPMFDNPAWPQHAIPVTVFGDGGKFTFSTSLYVLSWSPMLGSGDLWLTTLLAACIPKSCCATRAVHGSDTIDEIWKIVCDDLTSAFHSDFGGVQDADGDFLAVFGVCGDQEHHVNSLHLNHWRSRRPCWLCKCDNADFNWRDVSAAAPYRLTSLRSSDQEHYDLPYVVFLGNGKRGYVLCRILSAYTGGQRRPSPPNQVRIQFLTFRV